MAGQLAETVWEDLIDDIRARRCTPVLGAGASMPAVPGAAGTAQQWADKHGYPFEDKHNLMAVSQFMAVSRQNALFPKMQFVDILKKVEAPDFHNGSEPHGVLAEFPLPLYLTTNYDDFMVQALTGLDSPKTARREVCRWSDVLQDLADLPRAFEEGYTPDPANPTVYHLHGSADAPDSMVLTEDDYIEFLANIARNPGLLPKPIQDALNHRRCLFIGYRLADWNFRVLFQGLRPNIKTRHIAVLKPPSDTQQAKDQQAYLKEYYKQMNLEVYWGTAAEFCKELKGRYDARTRQLRAVGGPVNA